MESLNTIERFLLVAQHPDKGRFIIPQMQLNFGLAGAVLLELSIEKRLKIENKRLILVNDKHHKHPMLNMVIDTIKQSSKTRRIKYWVNKLNRKACKYKWAFMKDLEDKRIVRIEHKKFLGLIPYKKSFMIERRTRPAYLTKLRDCVLYGKQISEEDSVVLALIQACKTQRVLAKDRSERKTIRTKLKLILKESQIAGVVDQTIQEVQAAIMVAVIASTVTSTASH